MLGRVTLEQVLSEAQEEFGFGVRPNAIEDWAKSRGINNEEILETFEGLIPAVYIAVQEHEFGEPVLAAILTGFQAGFELGRHAAQNGS